MPYNSKEFKDFARSWGFKLITSSPTYTQSINGHEALQTVKGMLKKADNTYIGLMEYHNTPVTGMTCTHPPSFLCVAQKGQRFLQRAVADMRANKCSVC